MTDLRSADQLPITAAIPGEVTVLVTPAVSFRAASTSAYAAARGHAGLLSGSGDLSIGHIPKRGAFLCDLF